MFGACADGDREAVARWVGHVGRALVACGGDEHDAMLMGVGKRGDELWHICGAYFAGKLEAEVDHLRAMVDGEAHSPCDRGGVPFAACVEHAHGHDLHAVGKTREPTAVVRRLRDHARDECAMTVAVVRMGAA